MKLATYHDGSRDGQLVVVSRDLSQAHFASGVAGRLQEVLDDWNFVSPQLEALSQTLNHGKARHAFAFEPAKCMAPLPRAYQWAMGSAYPSHRARLSEARGGETPARAGAQLAMRLGGSDDFRGPREPMVCTDLAFGVDVEAGLAVITGDLALGTSPQAALEGIRLLTLANAMCLRHLEAAEQAQGLGPLQSRPATAFGPVAVTPDELGSAWRGGRLHLEMEAVWNGHRLGLCDAGAPMQFHFGELIAHLCRTRAVRAGSVVGSGPVSSPDPANGCTCIAEQRSLEAARSGAPGTGFMQYGDRIRIEMRDGEGHSLLGAIEQVVQAPG
jgi:fumarylacetoacetate (FAA) hydrolase